LQNCDIIMRTPGFEYFTPQLQQAKANGSCVTSEMELFFETCPCKIYAITGSDGKTTTSTLISEMLKAEGKTVHLGGNIGRALLPIVEDIDPTDVAVVELSSFQLISMQSSPDVAVVTNVTPNHLDHHKDMQEYIDAKRNILTHQTPPCRAILGYANEISRSMCTDVLGNLSWFTRFEKVDNGACLDDNGILCLAHSGLLHPVVGKDDILIPGLHNVENMLCAIAAVDGDVKPENMHKVATTFTGVEHRIEPVRTLNGVKWYNDSIASSPTRTIAGLRSFNQKIIIIAGGYDKKIPYEPLAPEIIKHVKTLVLMGDTGPIIEKAVLNCKGFAESGLEILHAENMADAVAKANANAKDGDVVSLSPASASFDKY
ncbi:MAG: UDP-N-acetylmuramoyl-L-alanine--D-glutamate ligase, partial [Oscillospiraceae bacterium]